MRILNNTSDPCDARAKSLVIVIICASIHILPILNYYCNGWLGVYKIRPCRTTRSNQTRWVGFDSIKRKIGVKNERTGT